MTTKRTAPSKRLTAKLDKRDELKRFLDIAKRKNTIAVFALAISDKGEIDDYASGDIQVIGMALHGIAEGLVDRGLGSSGLVKRPWLRRALEWLRGVLRKGGK